MQTEIYGIRFISRRAMTVAMIAAPQSAMGWAIKTPCSSKNRGIISKKGINRIIWRQALKNMDCHGFPIPWKKFPETMPTGTSGNMQRNIRMPHAASCCMFSSFGAKGATNVRVHVMINAHETTIKPVA